LVPEIPSVPSLLPEFTEELVSKPDVAPAPAPAKVPVHPSYYIHLNPYVDMLAQGVQHAPPKPNKYTSSFLSQLHVEQDEEAPNPNDPSLISSSSDPNHPIVHPSPAVVHNKPHHSMDSVSSFFQNLSKAPAMLYRKLTAYSSA
jgi:hypothetical protein